MKFRIFFLFLLPVLFLSCNQVKDQHVLISTEYGDIVVKLYDDTPLHRDNFIKLIKNGHYDGLLFHRIIPEHIIEGGSADSRNASINRQIGINQGVDYTINPEITYPDHFHKRGVVGAMLSGDTDKSGGSIFYFVLGKVYTNEQLDKMEKEQNDKKFNMIVKTQFNQYQDSLMFYSNHNEQDKFSLLQDRIIAQAHAEYAKEAPFKFTVEQRNAYTTIGGIPEMDKKYTVFGEITEGIDVLDKMENVNLNIQNRPLHDIKMKITLCSN